MFFPEEVMDTILWIMLVLHFQLYFVMKCRFWIIRKLVGSSSAVANFTLTLSEPLEVGKTHGLLMWDNRINQGDRTTIKVGR